MKKTIIIDIYDTEKLDLLLNDGWQITGSFPRAGRIGFNLEK